MKLEEYENLPEGLSHEKVEKLCEDFFTNSRNNYSEEFLNIIDVLCDTQWHTYELPSNQVKALAFEWVGGYINYPESSSDVILKVIYCFGLAKSLVFEVVKKYGDSSIDEYRKTIENSPGECIDPYWSMR